MYKKALGIMAVACSFALSAPVFAHSGGCGEGLREMVSSLKIDSAQKEKIKPILENLKTTMKDTYKSQMTDLDKQLDQQEASANMDRSTLDTLIDKKSKVLGEMMKAKIIAKNQILAVLTPEQKTELQGMMNKAKEKLAEKFQSCHEQE